MSPRSTHALHEFGDFEHFLAVVLVCFQRCCFGGDRSAAAQFSGTVDDGPADGLGPGQAGGLKLRQGS